MATVNTGKLLAGGLAAGVVINVVEAIMNLSVLAGPTEDMLAALNIDPVAGAAMGLFVVISFLLGILIVWTYAAIRPRYGPGPVTAMKAGLAVWVAFYLFGTAAPVLMGMMTVGFYVVIMAYSLVMMLAAAYVGGMIYKEE